MPKREHKWIPLPGIAKDPDMLQSVPFAVTRLRPVSELAITSAKSLQHRCGLTIKPSNLRLVEFFLRGLMIRQHRNMLAEIYRVVEATPGPIEKEAFLDWLYSRATTITQEMEVSDPPELTWGVSSATESCH